MVSTALGQVSQASGAALPAGVKESGKKKTNCKNIEDYLRDVRHAQRCQLVCIQVDGAARGRQDVRDVVGCRVLQRCTTGRVPPVQRIRQLCSIRRSTNQQQA